MTHRRPLALVVVAALAASLIVLLASAAGAQTTLSRLVFVNGASADPVEVVVNGAPFAAELEFAAATDPYVGEAGDYAVTYSDASTFVAEVPPATAWTIVSGFGEDPNTMTAYPVTVAAIPDGQAVVSVWNATATGIGITVDGSAVVVPPGELAISKTVPGGTSVSVNVGGTTVEIAPEADNYIDVFAVTDGTNVGVAQAIIPAMSALVEAITAPTVPDVVGQPASDATTALLNLGYQVVETSAPSDTVAAGLVISTQPAAGTELASGSEVIIVVSAGPSTVAVPDVVGQSVADAQSALEAAGLTSTTTEEPDADVEAGLVISMNPAAGIAVAPGTSVALVVSTGPEDVEVPDMLGLTADEATELGDSIGLTVSVVEDPSDPDPDGFVVEQDPLAGQVVPAGTEVIVQLSPATQDPWTSIKLDPDRILTAGGINFEPGSVSQVSVVTTTLAASAVVRTNGQWVLTIDTNSLDPTVTYPVLVTGTAEDGTAYEQTFTLPAPGEETTVPVEPESTSIPGWVWLVLIIALVAIVIIGVLLVRNTGGSDEPEPEDSTALAEEGAATNEESPAVDGDLAEGPAEDDTSPTT